MSLNEETQKYIRYILSNNEKKLLGIDPFNYFEYLKELSYYFESNYLDIVLHKHNKNHYINHYRKYLEEGDIESLKNATNQGFLPAIKKYLLSIKNENEKEYIDLLLKYSSKNDIDILEMSGDYYFDKDPPASLNYFLRIKHKSKDINFKIGLLYYLNNNDLCKNYLNNSNKENIVCVLLYDKYKNLCDLENCFKYYPEKYLSEYCFEKYFSGGNVYSYFTEGQAKYDAKLSFLIGAKYLKSDYEKAFEWFSLFDDFNNSVFEIAKMYQQGLFVKKNLKKSLIINKKIYEKLIAENHKNINAINISIINVIKEIDDKFNRTINIEVIDEYIEKAPGESNFFSIKGKDGTKYNIIEEKIDTEIQFSVILDNDIKILKKVEKNELFIYKNEKYAFNDQVESKNSDEEDMPEIEEEDSRMIEVD